MCLRVFFRVFRGLKKFMACLCIFAQKKPESTVGFGLIRIVVDGRA